MEDIIKKVFDQVKAEEDLKQKTIEFIRRSESDNAAICETPASGKKPIHMKRLIMAACAAVLVLALPIGGYSYYQTPTSFISIDINPSIELGVNAFGKVVTVLPYNTDGEKVIAGLSLENTNVESAVRQIVKAASKSGFIKNDGSTFISVTVETNNEDKAEELEKLALVGAEEAVKSEDTAVTIESDHISLDRRDEAAALGITPGKLNLIQKLQSLDPAIRTEDYKNATIAEIQKKISELKNEHKNDKDGTDVSPSSNPGKDPVSPSVSPSLTPSAPATPDKPGNEKHNGNENGNHSGNN
ncbi:MAG: hypothetical protein GXY05_02965, partial [Clostridiales bacterium]|nr:hypothetical protein [Clostridiales bacterium]